MFRTPKFGFILVVGMFLLIHNYAYSQHVVKTSAELIALLVEDKDQGVILLDGELFQLKAVEVKAGGYIKPYPGRKPMLIGFNQGVQRNNNIDNNGYWKAPITNYGDWQIIFLDKNYNLIPYSSHLNEQDGYYVEANKLRIVNQKERLVKIPIPKGLDYLKNRDKSFFKNFSIKVGYWFVSMDLIHLYSDSDFLYGNLDYDYHLDLLTKRPNAKVHLRFFNLPKAGDGIYIDGDDVLNVPKEYDYVRVFTTLPILRLKGNRDITFDGIHFTGGAWCAIEILGSNKHIKKCVIRNCGSGIVTYSGTYSDCSVENCLIENLYNNIAIKFSRISNSVIEKNVIRHTGTLMKGGAVIHVSGQNFTIRNNNISDFSYIAISAGYTREYQPGVLSGVISGNVVDNIANLGIRDNQLTDGGGIYVLTHTDGIEISDNIVRNIGYDGCELWGIYLDDGAYNCTVRRNLVYNMWPGQWVMTARYVDDCEHSNMNNVFENNIFIGPCLIAGNRNGYGEKTIIRNNYITGELKTQGDEFVTIEGNKFITATVGKDGRIVSGKGERIKKRGLSRRIKKLIKK